MAGFIEASDSDINFYFVFSELKKNNGTLTETIPK